MTSSTIWLFQIHITVSEMNVCWPSTRLFYKKKGIWRWPLNNHSFACIAFNLAIKEEKNILLISSWNKLMWELYTRRYEHRLLHYESFVFKGTILVNSHKNIVMPRTLYTHTHIYKHLSPVLKLMSRHITICYCCPTMGKMVVTLYNVLFYRYF